MVKKQLKTKRPCILPKWIIKELDKPMDTELYEYVTMKNGVKRWVAKAV